MIPLRFTSLSLSSSLLSVIALVGCSESGIAHDAVFAKATPAQIDRVYSASSGFDLVTVLLIADNMAGRSAPTGCPAIVTKGTVTTATGGCTTEGGDRLEGSIVIRDLPNIDRTPLEGPAETGSVELDIRGTSADGEVGAFEGRVEIDLDMDIRGDLATTSRGVVSTSRLELSYGSDGTATVAPGSEIAHSELGGAGVEGSWHFGDPPSGALILRGADELVFDIAHRGEDNCVPYAAGENRGEVCDTLIEPRRAARFDEAQVLEAQPVSSLSRMLLRAKR
ncbi:MAG TPA: hypothetical protein VNO30_35005 [Kofleriaceae bacterium]|nr:hypothetical protein [Kofleriaceae bacterium]